jgi:hypothetical protein
VIMWESSFWSVAWLMPLIGIAMCLACMIAMLRGAGGRHFGCFGHHGADPGSRPFEADTHAELRREIIALREELERLKSAGRSS